MCNHFSSLCITLFFLSQWLKEATWPSPDSRGKNKLYFFVREEQNHVLMGGHFHTLPHIPALIPIGFNTICNPGVSH